MSKFKAYIFTQDYKAPVVFATGIAHKPTRIETKKFVKGEVVKGILKTANGKPSFIMVGTIVVPISVVKEVVTKEIISNADGDKEKTSAPINLVKTTTTKGVKYMDGAIVGAILGFAGVYFAEKKGWIAVADRKNKIYGAIGGALLGAYLMFRFKK